MDKDAIINNEHMFEEWIFKGNIVSIMMSGDIMTRKRTIMHIDVNSAYLSWQAVYDLQRGADVDLRQIPSAVGGSQEDRRGIVLAKSIPAKAFGVQTGGYMAG